MPTKKVRIPLTNGDEYDALTGWRRFLHWRASELKKIKTRYTRRLRQKSKTEILEQLAEKELSA